jgi:hypothetical protein
MRIPLTLATIAYLIAFVICEILAIRTAFIVSIVAAVAVFVVSYRRQVLINFNRDKPETCSYKVTAPQAYSLIKKTLETFTWSERRWQIKYSDPKTLSIMAISEWRTYSAQGLNLTGYERHLSRQVILDVKVSAASETGLANVELSWKITAELTRSECNALQDLTKKAIREVLVE